MINKILTALTEAKVALKAEEEASHYDKDYIFWKIEPSVEDVEAVSDALIVFEASVHWYQQYLIRIYENIQAEKH